MKKYVISIIGVIFIATNLSVVAFNTSETIIHEAGSECFIVPLTSEFTTPVLCSYEQKDLELINKKTSMQVPQNGDEVYNYVVITTDNLEGAVTSSDFVSWKESIGHTVKIVSISDSEIAGQPGVDLPQKIRNFLREYYLVWSVEFVLIVGDHNTIPMRYCYPDPSNHVFTGGIVGGSGGDVPTDYYYADLSDSDENSWDLDDDGYFGEYGQDAPDFEAEVFVGRIPSSVSSRVTYALDKIVNFEKDTGSWKNAALHAGAFYYFTNENNNGYNAMDGATICNEIEVDLMSGWTVSKYSEQSGLETSVYLWSALTEAAFANDWKTGSYAIVNWGAHGWSDGAYRKVWSWDNGNGIPENHEFDWPVFIHTTSTLDDDHPSIVFAVSCVINYPEPNPDGQIGVDLLTKPGWGSSIGVIASTRSPWGTIDWPATLGGSESLCYEFNRFLISDDQRVGEALYESKQFCNDNYGWASWQEYNNLYCFNLYGDPSLVRSGISVGAPSNPNIVGPNEGKVNVEYDYTVVSTDTEGDQIFYWIEWGDETNTGWIGPYDSGEELIVTHSWTEKGEYTIKAKCKDTNELESGWGYLTVNMPISQNIDVTLPQMFLRIIQFFQNLQLKEFLSHVATVLLHKN